MADNTPLTRRQCLVAAAGTAGLLALGAAVRPAHSKTLVRPPGARSEGEFLALCLRCDRCRSICPQDVIGTCGLAEGLANLRTPKLLFHQGFCDFCDKCIRVCPTGALSALPKKDQAVGTAHLTEHCIALRTGACNKCAKACPEDAITFDKKRVPQIDADKCTGCGKCELVCPANVLQSYSGSRERGIVIRPGKHQGGTA